ncbi:MULTISPECIES: beta-N-acetylhexosaminidase [Tenebrionibacter/Tenebrionicola group]|uniref:beta-N-acetylhexosaminidase n=2 Tax=Tenebrionibacter/Tenebrionicola group TaxID=2969848 RepID=A0A8K0V3F3_9ENTR|nr:MULTISPECIES: beta-N-acetylhexosaminidase [Tenebrionibacter/Tenebrionicola group]MBK4714470.1 beta-N-acetylhexosaminidase [Tenebrionibacter intestinalis]MBV5095476.1 beta-N-acetylhexosaminidase [Tenebrionicola larvae]
MKKFKASVTGGAISALLWSGMALAGQETVDSISKLKLNYTVNDNHAAQHGVDCAALGADWASCNKATIKLTNPGEAITSKDWTIWFPSIRMILKTDSDQFKITHIVGDLHKLEPTDKFTGFPTNGTVDIPIVNEYWQIFMSDAIPRWYVTSGEAKPKVIASTDTEDLEQFVTPIGEQWKRTPEDNNILMTARTRFEKNSDVKRLNASALRGQILPTPKAVTVHAQDVDLSKGVKLELASLDKATINAVQARFARLGVKTGAGYPVRSEVKTEAFSGNDAVSGAYTLSIGEQGAVITGYDAAGVFYGLQSIMSLIPAEGDKKIAALDVKDAPRFAYRGMFIDVARNLHTKSAILRAIDQIAALKMNKFHFHLSDDEGWRIEIPGLPELTEVGGKRCHDLTEKSCLLPQLGSGPDANTNGSGWFTRADYIDIVKYAAARHVQVIPEIDMPAHARAAVISMEARYDRLMKEGKEKEANQYRLLDPTDTSNTTGVQYYDRTGYLNPCMGSSRNFVDKVIGEIQSMHKEAGQPLKTWHFGGDEAKNIYLGAGYTDKNNPQEGKGRIDISKQDKPWAKSRICQTMLKEGKVADLEHLPGWFALQVSKIVNAHGIDKMMAWQDGLKGVKDASEFATKRVGVNFWDTLYWGGADSVNDWANKGYEVTVSNPDYLYLDFPQEVDPREPGFYWGTRFSDERKIFAFAPNNMPQNAETSVDRDGNAFTSGSDKNWPGAYGISAQVWSEVVRTDDQLEYRLFPRLFSVAERAWHRAGWELDYKTGREFKGGETHFVDKAALANDWERFANLLGQRELAKINPDIAWRLSVPGARIVSGTLEANIALPGLGIQYSTDGGKTWQRYDDSARPQVSDAVLIRSVSPDGKRFSRVTPVN